MDGNEICVGLFWYSYLLLCKFAICIILEAIAGDQFWKREIPLTVFIFGILMHEVSYQINFLQNTHLYKKEVGFLVLKLLLTLIITTLFKEGNT